MPVRFSDSIGRRLYTFHFLYLTIFIILSNAAHAQQDDNWVYSHIKQMLPPSPEAASLGRYGDVSASLFSGVPNISIPIYTLNVSDFTLHISIDYNGSGVKVAELATNVGLGWNLSFGGVITTSIHGKPDIATGTSRSFPRDGFNPDYYLQHGPGSDYEYAKAAVGNDIDSEQDIFYYNFAGKSGKFVFNHALTEIYTIPHNTLKIKYIVNSPSDRYFIITDEKGVVYEFKDIETSLVTETCTVGIVNPRSFKNSFASSFYLSKIITPNGHTITFQYETVSMSYVNGLLESQAFFFKTLAGNQNCGDNGRYTRKCKQIQHISTKRIKAITCDDGFCSIFFGYAAEQREDVAYNSDLYGNRLSKISISSKNGPIREFVLQHDYLRSSGYDSQTTLEDKSLYMRLRLLSITETGKSPYQFFYNEAISLPNRLSYGQDLWGFYNGYIYNNTFIPKPYYQSLDPFSTLGANRESNPNALASILTKIVYPTGGSTKFDYENHKYRENVLEDVYQYYSKVVIANAGEVKVDSFYFSGQSGASVTYYIPEGGRSTGRITGPDNYQVDLVGSGSNDQLHNMSPGMYYIRINNYRGDEEARVSVRWATRTTQSVYKDVILGGARIKKITDDPLVGQKTTQNFIYTIPENDTISSIFSYGKPFPAVSEFVQRIPPSSTNGGPPTDCLFKLFSSAPATVLGATADNTIGYKWVTIYYDSTYKKGRVRNRLSTTYSDFEGVTSGTNEIYEWARGLPLETRQEAFNEQLNAYIPIYIEKNTYSAYHDPGFDFNNPRYPDKNEKIVPSVRISQIVPEFVAGTEVFPATFLVESTRDVSAWYMLKKSVKILYSQTGNQAITVDDNFTYDNPNHLQVTNVQTTNSKGQVQVIFKKYPHDRNAITGITQEALTAAAAMVDKNMVAHLLEEKKYTDNSLISTTRTNFRLNGTLIQPVNVETASNNNPLDTELQCTRYDQNNNLCEYITREGIVTSIIWGYGSHYPVARIVGTNYNTAKQYIDQNVLDSPTTTDVQMRAALNTLRTNLANAFITTYTYSPLIGMTSETDPSSKITYYEYDGLRRLKIVKDQNGNILKQYDYQYQKPITQ